MKLPRTLRGRLLLSHLTVMLFGAGLITLFAGYTLAQARLKEAEHDLEDVAFVLSNALEEPLEEYLEGKRSAAEIRAVISNVAAGEHFRMTVIGLDGQVIADTVSAPPPLPDDNPLDTIEVQAALQGKDVEDIRADEFGREALYFAALIQHEGDTYGVLRMSTAMAPIKEEIAWSLLVLAGVVALTALLVGAIGWVLAESVARPVSRLTQAAARIAEGHLDERVPVEGAQELSQLAGAFNHMTTQLETLIAEQQAFVANASHELRTPLTTVKLRAEALRTGALEDPEYARRFIEEIESQVDRLALVVNDLLDLSRIEASSQRPKHELVDLGRLAQDVCQAFSVRAERGQVALQCHTPDKCPPVAGVDSRLHRLLDNLVDNAIKHTPPGGKVTVTVTAKRQLHEPAVIVTVADTGHGIAPEHLPHIFERFYRADGTQPGRRREGTGLGLAIVQSIVRSHGGTVTAESEPDHGATFRITLPAAVAF